MEQNGNGTQHVTYNKGLCYTKINGGVYRCSKCHMIQWCDRVVTHVCGCNEFSKLFGEHEEPLHCDEAVHINFTKYSGLQSWCQIFLL